MINTLFLWLINFSYNTLRYSKVIKRKLIMKTTLHFSGWKDIWLSLHHRLRKFMSFWRMIQSSSFSMHRQIFVSSAKRLILVLGLIPILISLMKRTKSPKSNLVERPIGQVNIQKTIFQCYSLATIFQVVNKKFQ